MESYQETVLSAMKLSFFLIGSEIGEIPAGEIIMLLISHTHPFQLVFLLIL